MRLLGIVCWIALSVAVLSPASAQSAGSLWGSSSTLVLPEAGIAPSGFTVELTAENMHRFGDLPLQVTVAPTGPTFREDHELTFRLALDPATVTPRNRSVSYQFSLAFAAGSGPVSKTFYLPKWVLGGTLSATVLQSNQPLQGYSGNLDAGGPGGGQRAPWDVAWMESAQNNFCWIADPGAVSLAQASSAADIADLRTLLATLAPELLAIEPMNSAEAAFSVLRQYGPAAGLRYKTVQEVPADWQGIGQSHVWITRWSTYRWLAENRPDAELALRQFVRCGGALWLLDAANEQAVASHFKTAWNPQSFGVEEADGVAEAGPSMPADGQLFPDIAMLRHQNIFSGSVLVPRRPLTELALSQNRGSSANRFVDANRRWILNQLLSRDGGGQPANTFSLRLGLGLIIGSVSEDSIPGSVRQWRAMLDQSQEHLSSVLTRGVDPIAGNNRFWKWVIPGVAQPPVYTFIGLLSVFVILVGPVAYLKLSRMGRSYLMFLVAPALAMLTTLLLLGYGLVADGLGTQARVRQITWVCDRDGGAMRYWRSTYFAGVRPGDGLQFPAGSRLEPYHLSEFTSWNQMSNGEGALIGNVTLGEESLRLSSGFLPSRQQRQFVAYRPLENAGGLSWDASGGDQPPQVRNRFDYPLRELVLRAADGQYWIAEAVAAGATAGLTAIDDITASGTLTDLYLRNRPETPPGIRLESRGTASRMDLVNVLAATEPWRNTAAGQRATGGDGVMEWWLQHSLQTVSSLREGTFIALADVTDDCVAVPSAKLVQSIHYVLGELP